jgi:hypothetical protein
LLNRFGKSSNLPRVQYKTLALASVLSLAAACGDDLAAVPDASPAQPDAPEESPPCDVANYPSRVERVSVDLAEPFDLVLDGQGTRCEQIIRAVTDPDPANRPPELAKLDVQGVTGTCQPDDDFGKDIVRLRAPQYGGKPMYGYAGVQDVLLHVTQVGATVTFLHGEFFAAGAATNPACYDSAQIASSVPGMSMTYGKFVTCIFKGDGTYPIAADDTIEVGEEGYFVDDDGKLHRVRPVDVYLAPGNLTDEIISSDAYCCTGVGYDHCIGQKLFIDVVTGELLGQIPRCHIC